MRNFKFLIKLLLFFTTTFSFCSPDNTKSTPLLSLLSKLLPDKTQLHSTTSLDFKRDLLQALLLPEVANDLHLESNFLEIGVHQGHSSAVLALALSSYDSEESGQLVLADLRPRYLRTAQKTVQAFLKEASSSGISKFSRMPNLFCLALDSGRTRVSKLLAGNPTPFGVVLIDGGHEAFQARVDVAEALQLGARFVVFDDLYLVAVRGAVLEFTSFWEACWNLGWREGWVSELVEEKLKLIPQVPFLSQ